MMRVLPRSLFSRLVLVLLAGLAIAQGLSLAIHAHERGLLITRTSGMQAAQRITDIVKVLEPLAGAERRKMVALLSAPPLIISLSDAPPRVSASRPEHQARAERFEALVKRFSGGAWPVSVTVTEGPPWQPGAKMYGGEGPRMHAPWMSGETGPYSYAGAGISFVARVRLNDGQTVTFDSRQPVVAAEWPYRLLASLAILVVAVIALSLIAVRWATRPLNTLADAAEALGRNIHRPPLDEHGPLEVQRAARAFNTMQARLTGYIRDRTRILAAMSHDLKTPITRLRLRAELIDDAQMRSKVVRDLEEMEAMVSGTLDFMRGLENEEAAQPIDVNALAHSLQSDMQDMGSEVAIEGAALAPYVGKPQALKRCLTNLVDNAIKYGSRARVSIADSAQRLAIRVQDDGPGMPEAELERVFEPFYRLEESRNRETGGTGLGLSIARSIAESHGGSVALRNRPQGGLEASLTLPRAQTGASARS